MGFKARRSTVPRVTIQELRDLRGSPDQIKRFEKTFGDSTTLTDENLTRAVAAGLDVEFLIRHRKLTCQITFLNGTRKWYHDGELHRDDGPAIERPNGTRKWFRNGWLHRDDGPAVEWSDGTREWFRDGKHHRDDGPAYEHPDGRREWWRNGVFVSAPKGSK